jgi:hypothetical protein
MRSVLPVKIRENNPDLCYTANGLHPFRLSADDIVQKFPCSLLFCEGQSVVGELNLTPELLYFHSSEIKILMPIRTLQSVSTINQSLETMELFFNQGTLYFAGFKNISLSAQAIVGKKINYPPTEIIKERKFPCIQSTHSEMDFSESEISELFLHFQCFPFGFPVDLMIEDQCVLIRNQQPITQGIFYLSRNCLCFVSHGNVSETQTHRSPLVNSVGNSDIYLFIPLIDIIEIQLQQDHVELLTFTNHIHICGKSNQSLFTTIHSKWKECFTVSLIGYRLYWGLTNNSTHPLRTIQLSNHDSNQALWERYFSMHGRGLDVIITSEFVELLLKFDIPQCHRGLVWQLVSGSIYRLKIYGGFEVSKLCALHSEKVSRAAKEIELDLRRSLPNHPFYAGGEGLASLRRVLVAYSWRNPTVGYCQSMNILCAVFLLFMSEEEAFWLLSVLVEKVLYGYYSSPMIELMVDLNVLEKLAAKFLPGILQHISNLGHSLALLAPAWFIAVFFSTLPWEVSVKTSFQSVQQSTNPIFQSCVSEFLIWF